MHRATSSRPTDPTERSAVGSGEKQPALVGGYRRSASATRPQPNEDRARRRCDHKTTRRGIAVRLDATLFSRA
jgi:hypothetical protein